MRLSQDYMQDLEGRHRYVLAIIAVFFVIVLARLYYLQVIKGEFYYFFSSENSIKEVKIPAARGMVFDRRGQLLVENRPSFDLVLVPQYVVDPPKTFKTIERLMGIPYEDIEAVWARRFKNPRYYPLVLRGDISAQQASMIRAHKNPWYDEDDLYDLRGADVLVRYRRDYPHGNIASHVLGYVREIDTDRLKRYRREHPGRYFMADDIGVRGVEERWDLELRGRDGFDQKIVNAVGREVDYAGIADQLEHREAEPGYSLILTIDRDLQKLVHEMFGDRKGGAVALDPNTGAVLAMYSAPSYDLAKLHGPGANEYWNAIAADPKGYLINRTIQGAYPPGSTFKIVTGIAALSEGLVGFDETVGCRGGFPYGGRVYRCWARGGHGAISFHRALVHSCNVYFFTMGSRLDPDAIAKYANMLGIGVPSGILLSDERSGLIPTKAWKEKRFGVPWQKGETLSIAVGQGYNLVTPLQNALMIAQVVNGGWRIHPHLVEAIVDTQGDVVYRWEEPAKREKIAIPDVVIERTKAALAGVVNEGGTGGRLKSFEISMGGKTGTAQVVALESACVGEKCRDHAWFVGFAPVEAPEIAAAVVVEHGRFGAASAAPIVGALMQRYYDIQHNTKSKHPSLVHVDDKATAGE